ncbi:MAG: T9SS type A sorting domain-containing protein, partial [bacterium]
TDVPAQVDLTATDNCDGDITVSPTSVVTPGSTNCPNDYVEVRTWTFTDAAGNSSSVSQTITVLDVTPPVLTAISDPIVLRPPNHKYSTISLSDVVQSVTDNCEELTIDDVHITSVSSDEVENAMGDGDGNTWDDILFTGNDCSSVDLRRERQGGGNGRVYTVNLSVSDCVGNTATASAEVHIPHDDDDEYAVNDGTTYSNYSVDCNKSRLVSFTEEDILLTNYPNPFSGTTTIKFMIDETKYTTLKVYDIYGKLVATLFDDQAQAGKQYAFPFKAGNDASGIYFYHLKSGNDISAVQKMILMK